MSGWDQSQTFFSDPIQGNGDRETQPSDAKRLFKEFIKEFRDNNAYIYRDQLRRHYNLNEYYIEVDLDDLTAYNESLAHKLKTSPKEYYPLFELAAKDAADEVTQPRDENDPIHPIQVTVKSSAHPLPVRLIGASSVSKQIKVQGIIISASATQAKATTLTISCRNCRTTKQWPVGAGLSGATLPRTCDRVPVSDEETRCPIDPYQIIPDKCDCVDQQKLKLQELPELVPTGEMPRHLLLSADRYLTDKVVPGTRCSIVGIYSIFEAKTRGGGASPVRQPYIRITGIEFDSAGPGRMRTTFTPEEEEEMLQLSREPDLYERIAQSVAPSIYGGKNIKKAVSCLLFGGSAKKLPDGMNLRGDINVLLLGDPGTAKSQLLKFAQKVAPISVYTSGKGSSAAGLTASVIRDAGSREFHLEGGAMVLADGGVVCIDEFDKMRESDRVAIHEAMEQQTISIAKAGITTTLNSRTSVLAAANSAFGRWDDTKDADENIDFQTTILSRFDLIFIVKDDHNPERDATLARFVMNVHLRAAETTTAEGEISVDVLKKYIQYCRMKCGPRLNHAASEKLKDHFVKIRGDTKRVEAETGKRTTIPITVRQLEALVRVSESLAKMKMLPFATEEHVEEAFRLFKTSTMDAAANASSSGEQGSDIDLDTMLSVEQNLKRRFPVGSRVSESRIVNEFVKQNYSEAAVKKVLQIMLRRGEVEHQMQRRVLYRVK